jgi:hypothetical protein
MKVLLILSTREVHRGENLKSYLALKQGLNDLTWSTGTSLDMYRTLSKHQLWLNVVDSEHVDQYAPATRFAPEHFDIAIVDQSLDLSQDQSPAMISGGIANRSLDFEGYDRPSQLLEELTLLGTVCIGTSRNGVCLDELAQAGAVLTCPLETLSERLPALIEEAERLVRENSVSSPGLKALTLRQPFAWSVFHAGKDVENRMWPAKVRGTIAIHAADDQPAGSYESARKFIGSILRKLAIKGVRIPSYERLDHGAIIGLVDVVDCVTQSSSAWFEGPIGVRLINKRLLPKPIPCQGKRRFFTVPAEVERQIRGR